MSEAWKQLDLEGGGLQSANLRLAALPRKRRTAFALLALFPLGLHRDYLRDRRGAWLYRTATLLCTGAYLAGYPLISQAAIAVLAACAIYEALRIDDAVAQINIAHAGLPEPGPGNAPSTHRSPRQSARSVFCGAGKNAAGCGRNTWENP